MKYREVKRQAKVGEKIKIVNIISPLEKYKEGDIFTVSKSFDETPFKNSYVEIEELINIKCLTREYVVLEEVAEFTLADLKPCMVVKRRDEELRIVTASTNGLLFTYCGIWKDFSSYNDDMTYKDGFHDYDIMKVYGYSDLQYMAIDVTEKNRDLLWERIEEPEEMTLEEICKELGRNVKIVE